MVRLAKFYPYPFAKIFRVSSDIHCYIENTAGGHPHQFSLCVLCLIVESRRMPREDRLWLSCTKSVGRPASSNLPLFQDSRKNPRLSPNTVGSIIFTSGISVSIIFTGTFQFVQSYLLIFYCIKTALFYG